MIVTPGQLNRRAELYLQLGTLIGSGVSLRNAVGMVAQNQRGSLRSSLDRLQSNLNSGNTLDDSLSPLDTWVSAFDLALLGAAEQSGRLDVCFKLLADYYQERASMARDLISNLAYPAFLLHFAVFILPFAQFFKDGNLVRYLSQTLGILIPIYLVVGGIIFACQGSRGERWRRLLEQIFGAIPVLGPSRRSQAISRLAAALEALLNAGVPIISAWPLAAAASGSPRLVELVARWQEPLAAGETPSELVAASGYFTDPFVSLYRTGEASGQLDETLMRLHHFYREESSHRLRIMAQWAPRVIYLLVVLGIAYKIITFYSGFQKQINTLLE